MTLRASKTGGLFFNANAEVESSIHDVDLSVADKATLEGLIAASGLGQNASIVSPTRPGSGDMRTYRVAVEDGSHSADMSFDDLESNPAKKALFDFVKQHAR